jgi:uncharacterized protein YerC
MPTVITQLVIVDRNTQDILHLIRNVDGTNKLEVLLQRFEVIEKMLRRRNGRSKKLMPAVMPDDTQS